jgi:RHS repeat-associated protein
MVDRVSDQSHSPGPNGADGFLARPPSVELPRGGGAIRGIGEKFTANPVTGTGSMTIPLAVSSGRSDLGPELSLSYDSGAGNGPFGFGWYLSVPSITRKTDKGVPTYDDAGESDVYILSRSEDLVPVLIENPVSGEWERHAENRVVDGVSYVVHRYRPRVEGLFARIERWTDTATGDMHWRSISPTNVTTKYGLTNQSRIADPEHPERTFSWLICQSFDDHGNAIVYDYVPEDDVGIDIAQAHEANRTSLSRSANRYLTAIRYGNRTPNRNLVDWVAADPTQINDWMFEVVFDYGEGHVVELPLDPSVAPTAQKRFATATRNPPGTWPARQDPFSSYRAGFEARTYRLCRQVLMFHHFPDELGIADCLVRSIDLTYDEGPVATLLTAATRSGYVRRPDSTLDNRYLRKSMPPVELEYNEPPTAADIGGRPILDVDMGTAENLPDGLDGGLYGWVDLDGDGVGGTLTEQGREWFFKRNVSPAHHPDGPTSPARARLTGLEPVGTHPSLALADGGRLLDLAGDGRLDLVDVQVGTAGFFERSTTPEREGWVDFHPFSRWPTIDLDDPNVRTIDLTGDGHADVLITDDVAITWYRSLAEDGYEYGGRVAQALDEERGPRVAFADPLESIHLADLSGDGLTDLVRVRNGEICYWPNIGYGRFGARVVMDRSPVIDRLDQFDARRIQFVDVDGSGASDLVYAGRDAVRLHVNQAGNRWGEPIPLQHVPPVDSVASLQTLDLLANGTACLVWSTPSTGSFGRQFRYVDLMGGAKPFLLRKVENNLGAETLITYAPSTKFYVQDRLAGRPWVTRVPFPIHVVERIETRERIGRNRFVSRFAYHHGAFDGIEREFSGFGMVEQWDTEEFETFKAAGDPLDWQNVDAASHVPPAYTKTWFHTGAYLGRPHVSDFFAGLLDGADDGGYYREPGLDDDSAKALLLPDTVIPDGLTADEEREAARSLRGSMLRQETYGLDSSSEEPHPYTIAEQNFTIRVVQPRAGCRHAVFFAHPREAITYHYERHPADPRTRHALTLQVDDFGNVVQEVAVGYRRRQPDMSLPLDVDREKQGRTLVTYTGRAMTNTVSTDDSYRVQVPAETRTYELTGVQPENGVRFSFAECVRNGLELATSAAEIPYEDEADPVTPQRRLIEHARSLYRRDDLTGLLPLGELESLAVNGESYQLAFTPGLIDQVFRRDGQPLIPIPADVLGGGGENRGGYVSSNDLKASGAFPATDPDDHWWMPSGRAFHSPDPTHTAAQEQAYARQHFYLPRRYRDPFHTADFDTETTVAYDTHDLLLVETEDAVGNRMTVGERLQSGTVDQSTPGNDYRVLQPAVVADANRNRTRVAVDALGMVVATAVAGKPEDAEGDSLAGVEPDLTDDEIAAHLAQPHDDPHSVLGDATTRIVYDLDRYARTKTTPAPEPAVAYSLARETHVSDLGPNDTTRVQHAFIYSDGFGRAIQQKIQAEQGPATPGGLEVDPRWVGSGWTIFNNKGEPIQRFEPFFSDTHGFEFSRTEGVSPLLFYDPAGRVIATLNPNHTYEKVLFDPWRQTIWDSNDTVLADPSTDPDVDGFMAEYLLAQPPGWATWHEERIGGALGPHEQSAADKAAAHAHTPTTVHLDTLGRPFLSQADNGPDPDQPQQHMLFNTRTELDIEGNECEVRDAVAQNGDRRGRLVMRYAYDMLGTRVHRASMDAGSQWSIADVAGQQLQAWDSRNHMFTTDYDPLRRPIRGFVFGANHDSPTATPMTERLVYGEQHPNADELNLRGSPCIHFDQAGAVFVEQIDFKGNTLRSSRWIALAYIEAFGWEALESAIPTDPALAISQSSLNAAASPFLEDRAPYETSTSYDALDRTLTESTPHTPMLAPSIVRYRYNEANLVNTIDVNVRGDIDAVGQLDWEPILTDTNYNARGEPTQISYGNGAITSYEYDRHTQRLTRLRTRRDPVTFPDDCPNSGRHGWPGCDIQDLKLIHDPAGNITHVQNNAQQAIFFNNRRVEPSNDYTYDAVYRLVRATGREHLGQVGGSATPHSPGDNGSVGQPHPSDGHAMGTYTETFGYDNVANLIEIRHRGDGPQWVRSFSYANSSVLREIERNNQLSSTELLENETTQYQYDEHGNLTHLPHLHIAGPSGSLQWDHNDQLRAAKITPSTQSIFSYDAFGNRTRRVQLRNGTPTSDRIYLENYELNSEHLGASVVQRETIRVNHMGRVVALLELRVLDNDSRDQAPIRLIRYQVTAVALSVAIELADSGQVLSFEEYTPYGSTSYQATNVIGSRKRYRYSAKEVDDGTHLMNFGARYYMPWVGRWISADPTPLSDGTNVYSFVGGNPVRYVDRSGTERENWIQLWFYEAKVFAQAVVATRSTRGFNQSVKRFAINTYRLWGGQGTPDLAHRTDLGFKPQALLRGGEGSVASPQDPAINRDTSLDRALINEARARGEFVREGAHDPSAKPGTRYPQPARRFPFSGGSEGGYASIRAVTGLAAGFLIAVATVALAARRYREAYRQELAGDPGSPLANALLADAHGAIVSTSVIRMLPGGVRAAANKFVLGYLAFELGGLFVDKRNDLSPFYDYDVGATVHWRVTERYRLDDGEERFLWGQFVQLKSGEFVEKSDYLQARWAAFQRQRRAQEAAIGAAVQTLHDALRR